jgi:hypothetical protein
MLAWVPALAAQADRWERQAASALARTDVTMLREGWAPAGPAQFGALNAGEAARLTIPAPVATRLAAVGVCDQDCGGLGLIVGDDRGYDLGADRSGGTTPLVEFTPRMVARHTARIYMDRCQVSPCRFGIRVYRRVRASP